MENLDALPEPEEKNHSLVDCSFSQMPDECLLEIFSNLDILSVIRLQRVSRRWRRILGHPSLYRILELTYQPQAARSRDEPSYEHHEASPDVFSYLVKHGLYTQVKHLILNGTYKYDEEKFNEPHEGGYSHPPPSYLAGVFLIDDSEIAHDFYRGGVRAVNPDIMIVRNSIEMLTLRNQIVILDWFSVPKDEERASFRIQLNDVTILARVDNYSFVEVPCQDATIDPMDPHVRISAPTGLSGYRLRLPRPLQDVLSQKMKALSMEEVASLKEAYTNLVTGRRGCLIRNAPHRLLRRYYMIRGTNRWLIASSLPVELQTREFDFEQLDEYGQYVFVYYSKIRNFFRLIADEFPYEYS